ncbi:hypothetical protein ACIBCC_29920 [Streptomyces griseus]|uniref:hypothetical protein n=1 Tax=Streptomyces griseus TaxID=1911 RepID=UPI0037B42768
MQRLKRLNAVIDRYVVVIVVLLALGIAGATFAIGLVVGVNSGDGKPCAPSPRPTPTAPPTTPPTVPPTSAPSTPGPSDPPCGDGGCGNIAGSDGGSGGTVDPDPPGGNSGTIWGATTG